VLAKTKKCQTVENKRPANDCISSVKPCVFHIDVDGFEIHVNL